MPDLSPTTALVEFQIREANTSMEAWLEEWNIRAQDAFEGEPETSAYAAAVNVEAPDQVLIYERYDRGDDSLALHSARPAHKTLTDNMGERNMTRRRVFGVLANDVTGHGWWSRPGLPADRAGQILVLLGMRFETDALREAFLDITVEHAAWCLDNEPDTLIYSGGLARADSDRIDVRRGDLLFVMGCSDMASVTRHAEEPRHLALAPRLEAAGVVFSSTVLGTYETTGNGFLWR